jgi:hypothetical protein
MANKVRLHSAHWMWLLLVLLASTEATIGEDGLCNLFIFVPFTNGYVIQTQISTVLQKDSTN